MIPKVLIVDDNITNLKLTGELLLSEGFEVSKASSAERALGLLKKEVPDIMLLDIGLPGMDGLTFTRKLKSTEATKDLIIVALTAFAMKGDDLKAYEAGFDAYLTKPINTRKFASQIRSFLKKKASDIKTENNTAEGNLQFLI